MPVRVAAAGVEDVLQPVRRGGADGIRNGLLLAGLLAGDVAVPAQVPLAASTLGSFSQYFWAQPKTFSPYSPPFWMMAIGQRA